MGDENTKVIARRFPLLGRLLERHPPTARAVNALPLYVLLAILLIWFTASTIAKIGLIGGVVRAVSGWFGQ